MLTKQDIVRRIVPAYSGETAQSEAFAPANIALCKYWGKRDEELNLPVTSSLSISLAQLGSKVRLSRSPGDDHISLNGKSLEASTSFYKRAKAFLDLFRPQPDFFFRLDAENTIPTAAGFASSASGFAALVLALDPFFGWNLSRRELSILARLGSGSAARSVYEGFVEWKAGQADDGMDSFAERMEASWPELRMGLLVLSSEEKPVGSRAGMKQTVNASMLYSAWPRQVERDLTLIRNAIRAHDFVRLGQTAESNALAMHATMIATEPPILYWKPESVAAMHTIWKLRAEGLPLYFTMDAGPNLKLLFTAGHESDVSKNIPGLQVVAPFGT
ncbi:MAG TPA: diphosphomevalonate decarboxylase [Verrucomicrobia bacterium]|nr:MAG: diphosphomevalonate decarboxylase [Lentisphaerae bacterium GWF2_57_35]HBA85147.1 diphosphomevalonate decarboxylase [Verrucomicrobiota bacterium]